MKKNQLLKQRNQVVTELKQMAEADDFKQDEFDAKKRSLIDLDGKIKAIEEAERLELEDEPQFRAQSSSSEKKERSKLVESFDISKFFRATQGGRLDGVEKELADEAAKEMSRSKSVDGLILPFDVIARSLTTGTTNADGHSSTIAKPLDIIMSGSILDRLGVTKWTGLKDIITLNFSEEAESAAFVDEGNDVPINNHSFEKAQLIPKRVGHSKTVSKEYLSTTATLNTLLKDMMNDMTRALAKRLFAEFKDAHALPGFESTEAAIALGRNELIDLEAALDVEGMNVVKYLATKLNYTQLRKTKLDDGSGRFVIEKSSVDSANFEGYGFESSKLVPFTSAPSGQVIMGDWTRAYVGLFGPGVEMITDPYTKAAAGEVVVTYDALGDTAINPHAFKAIRNAALA